MVKARLYIICGNCGCDHQFKYKIYEYFHDELNKVRHRVSIICENCQTIHYLEDNADEN